jgi:glycosyltransferase involved in cell wall biosynthesis
VQSNSNREQISIAVVVPNYNHGRFLGQSLASIAGQTRQPDEVLILDDGSVDDSVAIISGFLADRPNWRLIRNPERRGVVKRQNEGMAEVRSDWITFLGADDLMNSEYLERAEQLAACYPSAGMVCGCAEIFGQSPRRKLRPPILPRVTAGYVSPGEFRDLLRIGDNFFIGTTTLYRRQAVLEVGGFEERLGAISDSFAARQLAARDGFGFIPEVLGYWRIHGQNYSVSTATSPERLEEGVRSLQAALAHEPLGAYPLNYSDTLSRRYRFGGARLIALNKELPGSIRAGQIAAMLNANAFERSTLAALLNAGFPGSVVVIAWLTIRLRPLSLARLLGHLRIRRSILRAAKRPPCGM